MSAARREIDYEHGLRLVRRLIDQDRLGLAARWADQLWQHRPDDPRAHNQAGLVRQQQDRPEAAITHFRRALLLRPGAGELWANLGRSLRHATAFDRALQCRRFAVVCQPDAPDMRLGLAFDQLAAGDYRAGFAGYEHRPDRQRGLARYAAGGLAAWDGRIRPGGKLLVATEQGAGDVVQFLRFVAPLAEQGMAVTVACPASLERVVRSAPGVSATVALPSPELPADLDAVEMLLSLPARLGIDRETLPARVPYIRAPGTAHRLPGGSSLRVGLCWTGSTFTPLNKMRRIPFAELGRVLDIPGIAFHSLQVLIGKRETEGEDRLIDLDPLIEDFGDTAAMIDQMDLVITVDTSVAHLAGALGKPVWTLLARVADWRWAHDGDTTPWYPTMRLYRQTRAGDWAGVVDRVWDDLKRLAEDPEPLLARRPFASADPSG